jgi:hypothetical protein
MLTRMVHLPGAAHARTKTAEPPRLRLKRSNGYPLLPRKTWGKGFHRRDESGLLISSFSSAAVQDDPLKKWLLFDGANQQQEAIS